MLLIVTLSVACANGFEKIDDCNDLFTILRFEIESLLHAPFGRAAAKAAL
jgi:hypothetical protein